MSDHPTTPVPLSPAEQAFCKAAEHAEATSRQLAQELRRRPSLTLLLADLQAAQEELEAARAKLHGDAR